MERREPGTLLDLVVARSKERRAAVSHRDPAFAPPPRDVAIMDPPQSELRASDTIDAHAPRRGVRVFDMS